MSEKIILLHRKPRNLAEIETEYLSLYYYFTRIYQNKNNKNHEMFIKIFNRVNGEHFLDVKDMDAPIARQLYGLLCTLEDDLPYIENCDVRKWLGNVLNYCDSLILF